MSFIDEKPPLDELIHYGTKMHSGRYPWGSGEDPYQRSGDFVNRIDELKKQGLDETEIAKHFGLSTTDLRNEYKTANNDRKLREYEKMKSLRDKGYSTYKIAEMTGNSESSVRSKLDEHSVARLKQAQNTAEFLKERMKENKFLDVSKDTEKYLNVSRGKMDEALYMLKMEGYEIYERYVDQPTNPGKQTTFKVLCPPGTDFKEFRTTDLKEIGSVKDFTSSNDGESFHPRNVYPKSMDSKRLEICYKEDGGADKDGIIEIRRGVEDLSLGKSRYAQVRILVDDDRYLKGVAVYADDLPDGVDVRFNTNKTKDVAMRDVLKKIGNDPDNPFGSSLKSIEDGGQYYYKDKNGKEQLGLINKRSDEGDWEEWSNNLPSQFLSKQPLRLAEQQLKIAIDRKKEEYDEICALTNPTVKKKMLEDFADGCDSAAVHLKAAAIPRQQYHLILPINSLKDNEVYAPNYNDGEQVALVRYPHGGTFEIPICTVNNKHPQARKLLGTDIVDAVGINSKVAERLSGADFDGDTVMVIPHNSKTRIKSTPQFEGLKGFDPKMDYATEEREDGHYNKAGQKIKLMSKQQKGNEMGRVSNLITDMTLMGATTDELEKAVKHSMVVIDAEKHKLDYKQSEIDNDIKYLKEKYQRTYDPETNSYKGGVATLISRAKSPNPVLKRQGTPHINQKGNKDYDPTKPEGALLYKTADDAYYADRTYDKNTKMMTYTLSNGKKVSYHVDDKEANEYYKPVKKVDKDTGEVSFTNKKGDLSYRVKERTQDSTKMAETDDATTLISKANTPMERAYANYANTMKSLALQARKEYVYTKEIDYKSSSKDTYINEVKSLMGKLNEATKNSPRERRAALIANSEVNAKKQENKDMSKEELKKLKTQAMNRARATVGAQRMKIEITDKEWEAIQAGAITKTKLRQILNYADMDDVRARAMPKQSQTLSTAQINSIKAKMKTGRYTAQEIAGSYGVSTSYINKLVRGKE